MLVMHILSLNIPNLSTYMIDPYHFLYFDIAMQHASWAIHKF